VQPCGPYDQRQVENRSDVLLFTSEPFAEDTAVVGRISVTLFVSSNQVDTDFTVKITDVYPPLRGEASVLIGDTVQRMRWRNGDDQPMVNMTPGQVSLLRGWVEGRRVPPARRRDEGLICSLPSILAGV
jgi:predicted acyl esterase